MTAKLIAANIDWLLAMEPMEELMLCSWVRRICQSGGAKAIRLAAGVTLTEMASTVGVDRVTMWSWEEGRSRPRYQVAVRYGQVLMTLEDGGPDVFEEPASRVVSEYQLAVAAGEPPTRRVAQSLGIPYSTAAKQIARARKAGLLPQVAQGHDPSREARRCPTCGAAPSRQRSGN